MERELFDWSGWDGDPECMIFYEPILKVKIGDFDIGTRFDSATVIQNQGPDNKSYLQFDNKGPEVPGQNFRTMKFVAAFEIHIVVGNPVTNLELYS